VTLAVYNYRKAGAYTMGFKGMNTPTEILGKILNVKG